MKAHDGMYIDGAWRPADGRDTIEVVNPADEQVIGHVPAGTALDVDSAVRAARVALPGWAATPPAERAARLAALRDVLVARKDEIAETVTAELGSPLKFSQAVHAAAPIAVAGSYAELAATYAFEEKVGNSVVHQEPVGVVGAITPWNYPLHQIVAKVAPALAAGCTLVLKPAEDTPLTAQLFAEAVHEAGVPAGVFNLVTGLGPVAGQALAEHPGVDLVSFTGSTAVGRRIGATAGAAVKRVALELGGKSANVILPSADLAKAVNVGVANVMSNSGQTCSAWTRMLVHRDQYDEAVSLAAEGRREVRRPDRPRRQRQAAGAGARLHREGRRRGRAPGRGRPRSPARAGVLRQPDRLRRRARGHDHRPGGDLRPGPVPPALRGRGRRPADRQRHGLRPRRCRLGRGGGRGGRLRPPDGHRAGRHQRRPVQPAGALRRLQAVRRGPRTGRARPRRVPPDQVPPVLARF
ncbi:aldehyde dehydrogenase (NAD+) [Streptomyces ambofaciens]